MSDKSAVHGITDSMALTETDKDKIVCNILGLAKAFDKVTSLISIGNFVNKR